MPPMLEYLDSLLTGTGHDLDLKTFKLVDQLSGRMLGLRADITPQVARIDAHLLNRQGVTRLVLRGQRAAYAAVRIDAHARTAADRRRDLRSRRARERRRDPDADAARAAGGRARRNPPGPRPRRGVPRAGARGLVVPEQEAELFRVLQAKDVPALRELSAGLDAGTREALLLLPELYGGPEVLRRARASACPVIRNCAPAWTCCRRSAGSSTATSANCASTWPSCAATTITAASCSRPTPAAGPKRSRAAAATTKWARRSAAPVRRPDSAWTCANWRAWAWRRQGAARAGALSRRTTRPAGAKSRACAAAGRGHRRSAGARGQPRRAGLRQATGIAAAAHGRSSVEKRDS